jgi:hypothetical protein
MYMSFHIFVTILYYLGYPTLLGIFIVGSSICLIVYIYIYLSPVVVFALVPAASQFWLNVHFLEACHFPELRIYQK